MRIKRSMILFGAAFAVFFGSLTTAGPLFAATTGKVLHSFSNSSTDGISPNGGLIIDMAGNLYGTTYEGGDHDYGTVFQLTPGANGTWTEAILYSFNYDGSDGFYPATSLTMDATGNLYGTTWAGGAYSTSSTGYGTVFELSPGINGTWTESVLYSFNNNGTDGNGPLASLILDKARNLYGTTYQGGAYNYGTVFKLSPGTNGTWTETVLYSFNSSGTDGAYPRASLIFDASGDLHGTTNGGGAYAWGTVYQLTPGTSGTWTEKVLYSFNGTNGGSPFGSLISDATGNLYGTTYQGGADRTCSGSSGCGTVFKLTRSKGTWTEKVLHSFNNNGSDGFNPYANLIFDKAGNLYGTTYQGGAYATCSGTYGCGTVFVLIKGLKGTWMEKVLHSFNDNGKDGFNPDYAGLIFDKAGKLYGMTFCGVNAHGTDCSESCGTVFQLTR
jgi:uncharacterized repeat protein (TIGR03803 family)